MAAALTASAADLRGANLHARAARGERVLDVFWVPRSRAWLEGIEDFLKLENTLLS
jgi:hypothetical protein